MYLFLLFISNLSIIYITSWSKANF